jgi:hypothetical protein
MHRESLFKILEILESMVKKLLTPPINFGFRAEITGTIPVDLPSFTDAVMGTRQVS